MPEILILTTLMAVFFGCIGAAYLLAEIINVFWRKGR